MKSEPCFICSGTCRRYLFSDSGDTVVSCDGCGLLTRVCGIKNKAIVDCAPHFEEDSTTEQDACMRYLECLRASGVSSGSVLIVADDVGSGFGSFLKQYGYAVDSIDSGMSSNPQQQGSIAGYDAIVFLETIERSERPFRLLQIANGLLKVGGTLMNVGISLDSWSAKFFGRTWPGWRPENVHYFRIETLQLLLEKEGFRNMRTWTDPRLYTLKHILDRAKEYPKTTLTKAIGWIFPMLPDSVLDFKKRINSSRVISTAKKVSKIDRIDLSLIMPVFNEKATFEHALRAVLEKDIEGVNSREIIIVESNSTDGTRELVRKYENHPEIRVIYEERPRGKGHAVRTGLASAVGEIVTIQDADTEYDVNDYDSLIAPLLNFKKAFVLGTRHKGDWKMRTFSDQPGVAALFNLGQIFFTWLMNTLYGQKMTDPFTMYKVFRRECLYGLHFECNRFDFDHELVIKLLRKGYTPWEVPVNYNSRSYSEGKKVTIVLDPLLWIKANFKYRFVSPFKSTLETDMLETSRSLARAQEERELVKR